MKSLAVLLVLCFLSTCLAAADKKAASKVKVTQLREQSLTDMPDKEGLMLMVEYPPGKVSKPHRHDAHTFLYIIEGSMIMQVEGKEPVTLNVGDTYYESPEDIHLLSKNASDTEPAKFLVVSVNKKGSPVVIPVAPKSSH